MTQRCLLEELVVGEYFRAYLEQRDWEVLVMNISLYKFWTSVLFWSRIVYLNNLYHVKISGDFDHFQHIRGLM